MADNPPPRLAQLTFHGPLSESRAGRLVERLTRHTPATVVDIGCGWGELLLRVLAAAPGAIGTGVDLNADDLARGRSIAEARGLADRVTFVAESAATAACGPADVVLCVGASHALSDAAPPHHTAAAVRALRRLVTPGGRVLLGEGFWQRTPTAAELAAMWPDASASEHVDLASLVDTAVEAGFRPAWIETANDDEWEEFLSGYAADEEEWLAANGGLPESARDDLDRRRAAWLKGYRGVLGMAYLTLVPVG